MILNAINVHDVKLFIDFKFFQRGSQGGEGQGGVAPPNCLENRTCKKFKSGEILRRVWGKQRYIRASWSALLHAHVYYILAKIRFPLKKLVQKLESEGGKLRFRALEIQNFPGGACPRTPPRWFVASLLNVCCIPNIHLWLRPWVICWFACIVSEKGSLVLWEMRKSIEIEKHSTIAQDGKPLDKQYVPHSLGHSILYKGRVNWNSCIISTDEEPSLQIETSFATINKIKLILFRFCFILFCVICFVRSLFLLLIFVDTIC